jgi:ribose 5-phosphate isomerase A
MSTQANLAAGKKAAAVAAVNEWIKDNQSVGIGSGSTIVFAVERIAERCKAEGLNLKCVPTSFQARQLILENGLRLCSLEEVPELDVALDGADEVDPLLNAIKGGGGCQTQEKIVAAAAKSFVIIADNSKQSGCLGEKWKRGLPIEVLAFAYRPVKLQIEKKFGGTADLRLAQNKAGPVVTDNGHLILDWKFEKDPNRNWTAIATQLATIPGVVETGIFSKMAVQAYFGAPDGSVKVVKP